MSQRCGAVDGQTARRAATDRAVTRHRPSSRRRRDVNPIQVQCIQVFPGVLAHRPISRSATTIRDPLPRLCVSLATGARPIYLLDDPLPCRPT